MAKRKRSSTKPIIVRATGKKRTALLAAARAIGVTARTAPKKAKRAKKAKRRKATKRARRGRGC